MTVDIELNISPAADGFTTWHITWGTYGARLHGGDRPTVDDQHNQFGDEFVDRDERRERFEKNRMHGDVVLLTDEERMRIEAVIPELCVRGGWILRVCAAGIERDHVHVLLDAPSNVHGKQIRYWLKRWITRALNEQFGKQRWWAEGGSTRVVKDLQYLRNATLYIHRQRATP